MHESLAIGADIGGTHITAAAVDLNNKVILTDSLVRLKVDARASSSEIIEVWSAALQQAMRIFPSNKVSLAIPGPFDYEKGICLIKNQDKYENLYGLNVKTLLAEKLHIPSENITLVNDAACFLQGEAFCGGARGFTKAIGITLGTGLGTCTYEDHFAADAGLWNSPFGEGIAEEYLSTRWFVEKYQASSGIRVSGVRELSGFMDSDPRVNEIFQEFGANLACFVCGFVSMALPHVVVIGGNIAKSYAYFEGPFLKLFHSQYPEITVVRAILGEEAALIGAASHWKYKEKQVVPGRE